MPDLKPGEFVSRDTVFSANYIATTRPDGTVVHFFPNYPNFPAALAALQAAHDEEQKAPWVEIDTFDACYPPLRIRKDGTQPQYRNATEWRDENPKALWIATFRAGLAVKR